MILDKQDVRLMQKKGARVVSNAKELKSDIDYLRDISQKLTILINRPQVEAQGAATTGVPPNITVQPPEVIVNLPEKQEPKQWKFDLKKNDKGQTTEIIATAIG